MSKDDGIQDVRTILDESQIEAMIENYDQDQMDTIVQESLVEPYKRAAPWVAYQMEEFFIPHDDAEWQLSAADRELVLYGVTAGEDPTNLAIHVYWGIAQGKLSVQVIAESLLLASTYKGIGAWSSSISTLSTALTALADQVDPNDPASADSNACIGAISAAFS